MPIFLRADPHTAARWPPPARRAAPQQVCLREFAAGEVLFQQLIVALGGRLLNPLARVGQHRLGARWHRLLLPLRGVARECIAAWLTKSRTPTHWAPSLSTHDIGNGVIQIPMAGREQFPIERGILSPVR